MGLCIWEVLSEMHAVVLELDEGQDYPQPGFTEIIETMNCEPENLRALCAPCHLRYDRQHHAEMRRNNGKRNNAERNRQ